MGQVACARKVLCEHVANEDVRCVRLVIFMPAERLGKENGHVV